MAKVNAPLFSFGARGKLANAIVFFPWKGIDCVRSYVIPANPKTALQVAQRGHLSDAVDAWHAASYTAKDVSAWNRWATSIKQILSGFNQMCKTFIDEIILGNAWQRMYGVTDVHTWSDEFEVEVHVSPGAGVVTIHYGTRKTHFPESEALDDIGGNKRGKTITGLTADTLYYYYLTHGTSANDYSRTGIYSVRTTA